MIYLFNVNNNYDRLFHQVSLDKRDSYYRYSSRLDHIGTISNILIDSILRYTVKSSNHLFEDGIGVLMALSLLQNESDS